MVLLPVCEGEGLTLLVGPWLRLLILLLAHWGFAGVGSAGSEENFVSVPLFVLDSLRDFDFACCGAFVDICA